MHWLELVSLHELQVRSSCFICNVFVVRLYNGVNLIKRIENESVESFGMTLIFVDGRSGNRERLVKFPSCSL